MLKYEKPHLRKITEDLLKVTRDLRPEEFVALLTGPTSNIHSTALALGQLPLTFYKVSFEPHKEERSKIRSLQINECGLLPQPAQGGIYQSVL